MLRLELVEHTSHIAWLYQCPYMKTLYLQNCQFFWNKDKQHFQIGLNAVCSLHGFHGLFLTKENQKNKIIIIITFSQVIGKGNKSTSHL